MGTHCAEVPCRKTVRFRRVGFLVYPDCQSLDLTGPFETFHWADLMLSVLRRPPTYRSARDREGRGLSGRCPD